MTILNLAVDFFTASVKRLYCADPRNVLFGSRIASRQACDTGFENEGTSNAKKLRMRCGAVGARSGAFVSGLLQTVVALTFWSRKDRSSRKNTSAFLPQRKLR